MSRTKRPVNTDDELREKIYQEVSNTIIEMAEAYHSGRTGFDFEPLVDSLSALSIADRKKHELQASYSQLLDAYIGLRSAGRELDLIAQAKRDRVIDAIQDRLLELKQELEKL